MSRGPTPDRSPSPSSRQDRSRSISSPITDRLPGGPGAHQKLRGLRHRSRHPPRAIGEQCEPPQHLAEQQISSRRVRQRSSRPEDPSDERAAQHPRSIFWHSQAPPADASSAARRLSQQVAPASAHGPLGGVVRPRRVVRFARLVHAAWLRSGEPAVRAAFGGTLSLNWQPRNVACSPSALDLQVTVENRRGVSG